MTEFTTTATGDRVAYDLRGAGPALIFVAGAGPFRAIDPWTTETAERAAQQGITTLVFDRLGRGESPAQGQLDLERELQAIQALLDIVGGSAVLCGHSSGCSISLRAAATGLPIDGLALWEAPFAGVAADTQAWSDEVEQRMDAGDPEGALSHYMKDMPPEWLAEAKTSSSGVRSPQAWSACAPMANRSPGQLPHSRTAVSAASASRYSRCTAPKRSPRCHSRPHASSKPSPAPFKKPSPARSTPGNPSQWRPNSPPSSSPASNRPQRQRPHRSVATTPCPSRTTEWPDQSAIRTLNGRCQSNMLLPVERALTLFAGRW